MKLFFMICTIAGFSLSAHAESLTNCRLYSNGSQVEEIPAFNIDKYSSSTPEANIDGGLFSYSKSAKSVNMAFSNECDNMYEISFSSSALAKAKSGEFKTIIGKATIGMADLEKSISGSLVCDVSN